MAIIVGRAADMARLLCGWLLLGAAQAPAEGMFQGFDVTVAPAAMLAGSEADRHLVYELHLTNYARGPLAIASIDVLDAETGQALARLDGVALAAALARPGEVGDPRIVPPRLRAIAYIDVPLTGAVPRSLSHRISVRRTNGDTHAILAPGTMVDAAPLPVLGPPLRGGPWVAVYDPAMAFGHRRVVYAVHGRARIPGRHAIDWMAAPGHGSDGAGADILAVADGEIVGLRDDVPDRRPGDPAQDGTLADAAGNYITLRLADGRIAVYEHLAAGRVVRVGDRVRRGEVIGRVGMTGQASRPHLHFHLGDSAQPLLGEGLPYLVESFTLAGRYESIAAFEQGGRSPLVPRRELRMAFPAPNSVVIFPSASD